MNTKRLFRLPKFVLFGLAALILTLVVGMVIPIQQSSFSNNFGQSVIASSLAAPANTVQRVTELKKQMLNTWQEEAKQKGVYQEIPKRYQGVTLNAVKPNANDKIIALTFDDGPWPKYTDQILNILKENNIKGTFFVIGRNMKNFPEIGKRIVAEGHTIANHTWHHWYHRLNPKAAAYEIDATEEIIYKVTGVKTNLFRPPGGVLGNGPAAYARSKKYSVIMWSADSHDYKRPAAPRLISNVMRNSKPGGIVLMHDGGGVRDSTVKALPDMIQKFRSSGYRFVTLPEMLELEDKELQAVAKK
ncbi:polysaccharide deacetylase family protein [Calothrix sp. UHCC 0171]|uniref:polysaccharide deacetylase family protein n=1 Tax=Calothrix sp. UHCC 0171 TaxID=3110245 RepID=UPI002B211AAB|nr:polysaccharide deacetylase family protein [Calothrix sp. UHCC 0171]MEA5572223.1 polysaccharide deacetylase family protein [Calothrix sp. UHCC 0171]